MNHTKYICFTNFFLIKHLVRELVGAVGPAEPAGVVARPRHAEVQVPAGQELGVALQGGGEA